MSMIFSVRKTEMTIIRGYWPLSQTKRSLSFKGRYPKRYYLLKKWMCFSAHPSSCIKGAGRWSAPSHAFLKGALRSGSNLAFAERDPWTNEGKSLSCNGATERVSVPRESLLLRQRKGHLWVSFLRWWERFEPSDGGARGTCATARSAR